jgi:NADPH:quinone reductase-like Zn-dependent oxidoreductase
VKKQRKDLNMFTDTQQMDAVVIQAGGPPEKSLAYRREPVPEPGPGEVLVEVHAAAVNPLDIANAAGLLGSPLPIIPGVDYAGVVVSGGDHAGQEVWGSGPALGMALGTKRPGTHARFVALPETWLSRKPERLTMTEAGAVGRPDGVEHFIDTGTTDMREAVLDLTDGRGADLVLDTVGGALFEPALRSLRFDGRMAGIFSTPEPLAGLAPAEIYNRQLHVTGLASEFMDGADAARVFDQLRPLFDRGFLDPPAVKTWPLENSAEAYQRVLDGAAGIKQVLLPAGGGAQDGS